MKKRIAIGLITALIGIDLAAQCTTDFSYAANWDTVTFTNLSTVSNAHYFWDFGDGSTSYAEHPTHVFIESGTFQVTLHALDTVGLCHALQQQWISITRYSDELCQPFMTYIIDTTGTYDQVIVYDGSTDCNGMYARVDAGPGQNAWPGMGITLGTWESGLFLARIRYYTSDSLFGTRFRRAYYRTLPYNYDPGLRHDTCAADFEYEITYLPGGAEVEFKLLGSPDADTIWVTGYGNPIPVVGQTSTFLFPYTNDLYTGPAGKVKLVWRRNLDPNYGCAGFHAKALIIQNPYYVAPPSCLIDPQPQDAVVYQNDTAQFFISSQAGSEKQWQQNAGLGWQDLYDAGPFNGVHTDTLTISNCQSWWNNYQYRCIVTASGNDCHNTSLVAVLAVMVGIEENLRYTFSLFPSPATERLNVQWTDGTHNAKFKIIDAVGNLVRVGNLLPEAPIDVSYLSAGSYVLMLGSEEGEVRARFLKQ